MSMKLKKKVKELTGDDATQASQIQVLQADVGADDTTAGGLKKRCKDIETNVTALETAVGDNTSGEETGIYALIAAINTVIGDAETSGTILYRLAQLEKE